MSDLAVRTVATTDAQLLAEAGRALDRLADDRESFEVLSELAAAAVAAGFAESALAFYDRCLRLALGDRKRQRTYADLAVAAHAAAAASLDPAQRSRHLHDGLYAATAALDPQGPNDPKAMCIALAHRAVMLAEIGHHESALVDARRARGLAIDSGMRREQCVAAVGEVIARWHTSLDTTVLLLIGEITMLAEDLELDDLLDPLVTIESDALWSLDRHDEARRVLQRSNEQLRHRIHRRRDAALARVGRALDRVDALAASTADALTGLPTDRHLDEVLPDVMHTDSPVCIAALDIDGFAYINETFGRDAGDDLLREMAALLERVCRRGDSVTRVGADEFVMVLRDASAGDARVVLERIRQLIVARAWSALPDQLRLTVSVGACIGAGPDAAPVLRLAAADALRQAKAGGGDRISFR